MNEITDWRIGVFASINAGYGVNLQVAKDLDIPTIQLHAPRKETRTIENAENFMQKLADLDIELTCVFGGFEGESYQSIPIVEQTVGLVPSDTRASRLQEMKEISDFARILGCDVVGLHLGFVPEDRDSGDYQSVLKATRDLCSHASSNGQTVHLETGQEGATELLQFIQDCDQSNLFINFDPANMILYGTGNPIEALKKVAPYVRSVHCKDAVWSEQPGVTWGQEVALGKGDVNIESYLQTLKEIGYDGPLTIEREIPQEPERQKSEIEYARDLLLNIKQSVL